MGIKNDKIKSHIKTQLANDRKCDKIINLCWHLPPCDATCNVKDIFIWSICIICVNPQRDLWGRGGLKYHWPLIGPFLQGSLLIGGESSPAQHIIRYQTPGMGRGKTFNCPDTPRPGQQCWGNYCKLFDSLIMISKYPNNEYFQNIICLISALVMFKDARRERWQRVGHKLDYSHPLEMCVALSPQTWINPQGFIGSVDYSVDLNIVSGSYKKHFFEPK